MTIQKLTDKSLLDVVRLHEKTLQGLSTALGRHYLQAFYQTLFSTEGNTLFGSFQEDKLVGYIIVTSRPHTMMHALSPRLSVHMLWSVTHALLANKITFIQIVHRFAFGKMLESTIPANDSYILVLTVDEKFRKHHIASDLLAKACPSLPVWVDTKKDNNAAVSFYRSHKFTAIKSQGDSVLLEKTS
jgi:ribosomal protein S18 acetylase RimI-like enzyme